MKPQTIANATRELGKPVDWDESKGECKPLAIRDETHDCGNVMVSEWKPSADELRQLNEGGSVLLYIVGKSHPPVHVDVQPCQAAMNKAREIIDEKVRFVQGKTNQRAPDSIIQVDASDNEPCTND